MKTIGLLGGMSWESSIVYEQIINQEVRRLGGLHSADLLIRSYDFAVVERLQVAGAWGQAGRLLATDARRLEGAGADLLVQGVIRDQSRERYLEIIGRLRDRGAEGVIAGCTEIELLVTADDAGLPYFPTTRLHALAAVDLALSDS
jgi:aspartate/glutamate racemase